MSVSPAPHAGPAAGSTPSTQAIHQHLIDGDHHAAYADLLLGLRTRPVPPALIDLLINVATVGEYHDEALAVLRDLRDALPVTHFTLCEGRLCLLAGNLDRAVRCAEGLMARPDGVDAGLALHAAIAERRADPAAQLRWMRQREARLAQVPLHLLPARWSVQNLLGQQDQILADIARVTAAVPAMHQAAHHMLDLQRAMALHGQLQFADSRADALALAGRLAHTAPTAEPPGTVRVATRRRQNQILASIERLVLTRNLPVTLHAGTLLGLTRTGELLPGDQDIDLAVIPPATSADVTGLLIATGEFKAQPHNIDSGNFRSLAHQPTGLTVDITEYERADGLFISRWRHPSGIILREASVPAYAPVLTDLPGIGRRLPLPDDPAALLTATYGDWRTPNPCFDTMVAAPNLLGFTDFLGSVAAIRLADSLMGGRHDMARHLVALLAAHGDDGGVAQGIADLIDGDHP